MKANYNNDFKIDWIINAICDEKDRNNPECVIEYQTTGYDKYGNGEIVVLGRIKNAERIATLINSFGRLFAKGEKFDSNFTHNIWNTDGVKEFTFDVEYAEYDNGEKWIQLIPDFEMDIFANSEDGDN